MHVNSVINSFIERKPKASDLGNELRKLYSLKEQGILTEQEFQAAKKRLLERY